MPRGFVHDRVLLNGTARSLAPYATWIRWEVPVHGPGFTRFVDLLALIQGMLLVVEAEMTAKRVPRDVHKAHLLGAQFLWILVPNAKVRRAAARQLLILAPEGRRNTQICLLTPGQVPSAISNILSLISKPLPQRANNK
jgi:hypothetical protein